jgi:hypothetical protein
MLTGLGSRSLRFVDGSFQLGRHAIAENIFS